MTDEEILALLHELSVDVKTALLAFLTSVVKNQQEVSSSPEKADESN